MDWTCLPGDIRDMIFGTSTCGTLGTLRLVCKGWRDSVSLLRTSYYSSSTTTPQNLSQIFKIYPRYSTLNLGQSTQLTCADLECLSTLQELRVLNLPPNVSAQHIETLGKLPNVSNSLREIQLLAPLSFGIHKPAIRLDPDVVPSLTVFQKLASLIVGGAELEKGLSTAAKLPHLTALNMSQIPAHAAGIVGNFVSRLSDNLKMVSLSGDLGFSCADTDSLCHLPNLQSLYLNVVRTDFRARTNVVSPPSFEGSKWLSNLVQLEVPYSICHPDVLVSLANLSKLTHLVAHYSTGITPDQLRQLAVYCPRLGYLQVPLPRWSNDSLEALSHFSCLRRLALQGLAPPGGPVVTEEGTRYLTRLSKLESFLANNLRYVSDSFGGHVASLSNLRELSLSNISMASAGLQLLSSLRSLLLLTLDAMPIDDAALNAIVSNNTRIISLTVRRSLLVSPSALSCLKSLSTLSLSLNPSLTDDAIVAVSNTPLKVLDVFGTRVTGIGFSNAKFADTLCSLFILPHPMPLVPEEYAPCAITPEGALHIAKLTRVSPLHLSARVRDDVFDVLCRNGKYERASLLGLTAAQAQSLLRCTTLRALALSDNSPDVTENVVEAIKTTLPKLESFVIRNLQGVKTILACDRLSLHPYSTMTSRDQP